MAVHSRETSAAAGDQTSCLNRIRVASDGRGAVTPTSGMNVTHSIIPSPVSHSGPHPRQHICVCRRLPGSRTGWQHAAAALTQSATLHASCKTNKQNSFRVKSWTAA